MDVEQASRMDELESLLGRWANFYTAMMQVAAALIGLLFVVIALGAQQGVKAGKNAAKISVYMTPPVIYFAAVLILSALLTFPSHTLLTATLCTVLLGTGGIVCTSCLIGNRKSYEEKQDLIVYAILPFAAHAMLVVGGILLLSNPRLGLTLVALGMLSLLTISIRNSWAIAIDVVRRDRS